MHAALSSLAVITDRYAHGECVAFALACFRRYARFSWRLVEFHCDELQVHVACEIAAGVYFDAYGFCTQYDLEHRYQVPTLQVRACDCSPSVADTAVADAARYLSLLLPVLHTLHLVESGPAGLLPPQPTKAMQFQLALASQRSAVLDLLAVAGCGPMDGGCLVCAQALQQVLGGGELMVLVRDTDLADHVAVAFRENLWDLWGPVPPVIGLARFNATEHFGRALCTRIRPLRPDDVPDALRDSQVVAQLVHHLTNLPSAIYA